MERSHEYYTMETQKFDFFQKSLKFKLTFDEELKSP